MKRAILFRCREDRAIHCFTCSFKCELRPGETGKCGVRSNIGGDLIQNYYGIISKVALKKGVSIGLTDDEGMWCVVGTVGCNFKCPSCRYGDFAYENLLDYRNREITLPDKLIEDMKIKGIKKVAFGFNEPFIQIEYVIDTLSIAKREGFETAILTNGFFTKDAFELVNPYVDRYVVYVKAFTSHSFKLYTGNTWRSDLVFENILVLKDRNCRFDIATILVSGVNDSVFEIRSVARWILFNLGSDFVWHIYPFKPTNRFFVYPPMSRDKILKALDIAVSEGLTRIYLH
ncbi:MAG: radical SAM protein [Thermosulfidibacteraceae bacterium]